MNHTGFRMRSGLFILTFFLFQLYGFSQLNLTVEEKEWLAENPVIKVANEDDWPPFDYSEKGKALGLTISYVDLLAKKLGVRVEYVNGYSWNELLEKTKNHEIDVMPCIWYEKEREEFLTFTTPYISNPQVIVTHKKNQKIRKVEDLKGSRVAFITNFATKNKILEQFPEIKVVDVNSPLEALLMVNLGSVDAYIDSLGMVSYQIDKNLLTGLQIAGRLEMEGVENINNLYMAVRKDWPLLHSALQKALDSMTEEEKLAIHENWLMKIEADSKGEFKLLETEKKWLSANQSMNIGMVTDKAPMQYMGVDNSIKGIVGDYLKILFEKTAISYSVKPSENYTSAFEALNSSQVNFGVLPIISGKEGVIYSDPLLSLPIVAVTKKEEKLITSLSTFLGKKVAVVKNTGVLQSLSENIDSTEVVQYSKINEAMEAVEKGEVFAFFSDSATSAYFIQKYKSDSLGISYTSGDRLDFAFAAQPESKELITILNRFVASIPEEKKRSIEHQWLNLYFEKEAGLTQYLKEIIWTALGVLFIIIFIIFWNRKLANEIERREEVEKSLENARKEAEKSNQAKSEFLAIMSHEIRTPLNGILGMSQILSESGLTEEQKEQCDIIVASGKNLLTIINDILDFSKIEAGKLTLEKHPFSLRETLDSVVNLYETQAEDKGLYLRVDFHEKLFGSYKSDEGRIRQVLLNLVSNALKFTHEGGVTIKAELVENKPSKDLVQLSVKDTGIGISDNAQAKLFQKFTQADSTTTRKYGGTGLGLAISKTIIDLLGGSISLKSREEEGSTFVIELPLEKATYQVKAKSKAELNRQFEGLKVLLVEDNVVNQKIAKKVLVKLGCEVSVAGNGKEALERLDDIFPEIIFMDCHMPEMDGYDASRKIRYNEKFLNLPIIAMTANAMEGDREKCLAAGMTDYLTKPFDKQKLVELIDKYSGKSA